VTRLNLVKTSIPTYGYTQPIALLAISFVAIFCSMEMLWRLHLEKQAAESNRQEMRIESQKMSLSTEIGVAYPIYHIIW
jgi:hypothetical protein